MNLPIDSFHVILEAGLSDEETKLIWGALSMIKGVIVVKPDDSSDSTISIAKARLKREMLEKIYDVIAEGDDS